MNKPLRTVGIRSDDGWQVIEFLRSRCNGLYEPDGTQVGNYVATSVAHFSDTCTVIVPPATQEQIMLKCVV